MAVAAELAQLLAQLADLGAQLAGARHAAQDRAQALDSDRLHHVAGGAQSHRLHRPRAVKQLPKWHAALLSPRSVSALPFFPLAWCVQHLARPSGRARASPSSPPRARPARLFLCYLRPSERHMAAVMLCLVLA